MISAPQKPTEAKLKTAEAATKPSVKMRGHLTLLDWDKSPLRFAPAPTKADPPAAPQPFGPKGRTLADRCYDGGTLALLAVTVAALAATLARF